MRAQVRRKNHLAPTAAAARPGKEAPLAVVGDGDEAVAKTRLLEAAIRLCCRKGIAATSVNEIIEESGVARMTLYNRFGSKDALILAALEHEATVWRGWFFARLAEIAGSPQERLLGVFDILEEWFRRDDYFGCALMNASMEARNRDPKILELVQAHKKYVLEQLRALAAAAGVRDAETTTQQIDLLMDGAIVKAAIKRNAKPAAEAKAIARALLRG